jgi:hypothetical protein
MVRAVDHLVDDNIFNTPDRLSGEIGIQPNGPRAVIAATHFVFMRWMKYCRTLMPISRSHLSINGGTAFLSCSRLGKRDARSIDLGPARQASPSILPLDRSWDAVDPHTGLRRIDSAFPKAIRESTHEGETKIKFKNGSLWQVVGSDNYHSLVGTPPCGLTFSEWARAVPESYGYLNPILTANNGWAIFISTPLGNNHFKRMLDDARTNSKWFADVLPVQASGGAI